MSLGLRRPLRQTRHVVLLLIKRNLWSCFVDLVAKMISRKSRLSVFVRIFERILKNSSSTLGVHNSLRGLLFFALPDEDKIRRLALFVLIFLWRCLFSSRECAPLLLKTSRNLISFSRNQYYSFSFILCLLFLSGRC